MFLDYFALFILLFVVVFMFYGIIVIHDIPYEIAKKRNHPQQDALHVAGWVSLFTLHAIWPFLWIWATLYREDRGWGFKNQTESEQKTAKELEELKLRLVQLEAKLAGQASPQASAVTEPVELNKEEK
ncbi:DUF3302 domain-containing protein [Shewanella gelidii]|uniref:DUF3302 domain-containing protein n=1 Tax=Shewanella gelidii TaxID=1642821 RepID=A0A917JIX8_9GAMM|nr:DUF3302 domain-containing protein [Shewanella gelidii]MCL1096750.1 DUF3302 domain-containing protein [Shewanella gelidii]GGI69947.1 hypothetical protein GCM10009332_03860 [Shewanella gelidii]